MQRVSDMAIRIHGSGENAGKELSVRISWQHELNSWNAAFSDAPRHLFIYLTNYNLI